MFTEAPTTAASSSASAAGGHHSAEEKETAAPPLTDRPEPVAVGVKIITPRVPETVPCVHSAREAATARIMRATTSVLGKALQQTRYQPRTVRIILWGPVLRIKPE